MSRIEELIEQYCPDGVEYVEMGKVVKLEKGKQLNKELLSALGKYPAYNGGVSYSGYTDNYNYSENTIIISQGGASAGFVNYVTTKFYANAHCFVVLPRIDVVVNRFVYHFLKLNQGILTGKQHGAGIPALRTSEILGIHIPIPPLPVQEEIVRILDKLAELEAELEAKLEAELEARKKQYEYYRNKLLTPVEENGKWMMNGEEVEWKMLGEVGHFVRGSGLQKKDFAESGIGCIHYGQIYTYYGVSTKTTKSFVSNELAAKLQKVKNGDIIFTNTSENIDDVCKAVAWLGVRDIVTGGHASIFKHNENPLYIAYLSQTNYFFEAKKKHAKGTKVIDVSAKDMAKILIPLPLLAEQERIVSILEKFDSLVNDISIGLPAEIEARKKQYEYYRNKLLSFKRKDS